MTTPPPPDSPYATAPNAAWDIPQQAQPQQQEQWYAPQGPSCRFCGGLPAVAVTVRGHRGMILVMQWRSLKGPFCRTCGIATVRRMSADTLWQGWWGYISFAVTPVMLIINLFTFLKIRKLPEPIPGMPGRPMDMGEPLLMRWAAVGFLIPVALIYLIVMGGS